MPQQRLLGVRRQVQQVHEMLSRLLQQSNKLATAVAPFDPHRHMPVVKIRRRQNRTSAQALVFMIPATLAC